MSESPTMPAADAAPRLITLEQAVMAALLVFIMLLIYYLFQIGNKQVEPRRRLSFGSREIKLLFFIALGLAVLAWLIRHSATLLSILTPFIISGVLAYAFNPLVKKLMSLKLSRTMAVAVIFVVLLFITVSFSVLFFPLIVREIAGLIQVLPQVGQNWYNRLDQWYEATLGRESFAPDTLDGLIDYLNISVQPILDWFARTSGGLVARLGNFASSLVHLVTIPVLMFYFLKDSEQIGRFSKKMVPARSREWIFPLAGRIDQVLGGFIRGQLLVALIIGILSSLALLILGIDYWIILGIMAGLGDLVPYVGPFLGAIPAVLLAFTVNPLTALWVIIAFLIIQQLEGSVISPRIVGDSVGLHPAAVIFVLLVGGALWGLVGLLVAVPLAGIVIVLIEAIHGWFRKNYPILFNRQN